MSERDVFTTARAIADLDARAAFLDRTCVGNAVLRERVERLLHADAHRDSFLDAPVGASSNLEDDSLAFLTPSERPDSLGRLGHYEILEVLGKGGFGIVFRAFDDVLQRVVAVKILMPLLAALSPARKRFLREARSVAGIRHENVVQVFGVEELPLPHLIMEFIPGETLQQRLDHLGPLDVSEVVRIGRQIAEALAAAHDNNLIHRDVKPANVLLESGPHGQAKLTDFGLARAADDASITQSGYVAGTPMYMSPEQARGESIDSRSDLFSLGSVLYVMTTGRPPFRAATSLAVLKRVNEDMPRPIPEIIPETPGWLCALIARLHAKDPAKRFASAREVADLLAHPHPESSPAILEVPTRNRSRGRRWAIAVAGLLLLAGLGLTRVIGRTEGQDTLDRTITPEGTLVVEKEDPDVCITLDGEEVAIAGAGSRELLVKPGQYWVEASKDGKVISRQLVAVTKDGKQVVRISRDSSSAKSDPLPTDLDRAAAAWALGSGGNANVLLYVDGKEIKLDNMNGKDIIDMSGSLPTTPFEMRSLNLNRNKILRDDDLAILRGLKHLTFLQITNAMATNVALPHLAECKKLQTLLLYSTGVTDAGLPHLAGLTELRNLSFQKTRVSEAGVKKLSAALPKCRIEWNGGVLGPVEP